MRSGDFTGDGKADIVAVESESNGKFRYMLGTSNGSGIGSWSQVMGGMSEVKGMAVGDFSGDGKADIVAVEPSGGSYRYMLGTSNGSGVASWSQVLGGMSEPRAVSVGDFSGDGKADVLAAESEGNGKYRYMLGKSNGSGIASWNQILGGMAGPRTMAVGDFTGDGKADIVVAELSGSSYRFMLGVSNGSGIANWSQVIGGLSEPQTAPVGDFNGDGKADIIAIEKQ
jgi:hypothetical protein